MDVKLKSNLGVLLAQRDMRAKELADLLDTSETVVSNWKNDRNLPTVKKMYELAHVLDCTVNDLYTVISID